MFVYLKGERTVSSQANAGSEVFVSTSWRLVWRRMNGWFWALPAARAGGSPVAVGHRDLACCTENTGVEIESEIALLLPSRTSLQVNRCAIAVFRRGDAERALVILNAILIPAKTDGCKARSLLHYGCDCLYVPSSICFGGVLASIRLCNFGPYSEFNRQHRSPRSRHLTPWRSRDSTWSSC